MGWINKLKELMLQLHINRLSSLHKGIIVQFVVNSKVGAK
jgi:hypothetical protein